MTLSELLPPGFTPPSAMQLIATRRAQLSEPFRLRGRIQRKPLAICRFDHARHLVQFCGFTANAARINALETFPA